MLRKLIQLSLSLFLSVSLLATSVLKVEAIDVKAKVILNALSKKIVNSVDTFYQGRDESLKPIKIVKIEGSYDELSVPSPIILEEDIDDSAKYSFIFPAVISSVINDLFAKDFGKKRKLKVDLKSVNSIVGSFFGDSEFKIPDHSVVSVTSVNSVGSISNLDSSLKFETTAVRAVRTKKNPGLIKLKGIMKSVVGLKGSKKRLAKGRFILNFSQ